MSKTINDIIEDFDSKMNAQEVSKSVEDEQVEPVQDEAVETPEPIEEGVEVEKQEEQPVEAEEAKEDSEPESSESAEQPEAEPEVKVEEVEKSDKSEKEDEEEKKASDEDKKDEDEDDKKDKKKDKEDKKEDEDKEDKEDVKKSDESEEVEKSALSPKDILGGFEAVFKNMANLVEVQKSLTDTITELKTEIVSLREANAQAITVSTEDVNKSILVDNNADLSVEGKAVGFVSKSVEIEPDTTSEQEDVVEVVVDGVEQSAQPLEQKTIQESALELRDDFMTTFERVAQSGTASRGELDTVRQLWGKVRTEEQLNQVQSFIDKYK